MFNKARSLSQVTISGQSVYGVFTRMSVSCCEVCFFQRCQAPYVKCPTVIKLSDVNNSLGGFKHKSVLIGTVAFGLRQDASSQQSCKHKAQFQDILNQKMQRSLKSQLDTNPKHFLTSFYCQFKEEPVSYWVTCV